MTPCEQLGYAEGDLFEVIPPYDSEYVTEGMIVSLYHDYGSMYPGFKYVSGDKTKFTDAVKVIYLSIYSVKKIIKFKVLRLLNPIKLLKLLTQFKILK